MNQATYLSFKQIISVDALSHQELSFVKKVIDDEVNLLVYLSRKNFDQHDIKELYESMLHIYTWDALHTKSSIVYALIPASHDEAKKTALRYHKSIQVNLYGYKRT